MLISRQTKEITIEVETAVGKVQRRFRLREMSPAQLEQYIAAQERMREDAIEAVMQQLDSPTRITNASTEQTDYVGKLALSLLQDPVDGEGPATEELMAQMSVRMRTAIIKEQDALNNLEELVGKSLDLLSLAMARRSAEDIIAGSKSVEPSPGPDTPQTP
ncbi:MAG: hypothetical protein AB7S38_29025 [Vulcanimicrobiota bacterium]